MEVNSEQLFPEVEVNSEQLFIEVEVNRPRRGEYTGLFTDTEVNNYISIYQTKESVM